jgi:hypothetical protein
MRIGDWKSLSLPKESARGGYKGLGEDHGRDRQRAKQRLSVIQSLGGSRQIARKVTLMVVRSLAEPVEPIHKPENGGLQIVDCRCLSHCAHLKTGQDF